MSRVPPPLNLQYQSNPTGPTEDLLKIAAAQKLLLWAILANIAANLSFIIAGNIIAGMDPRLSALFSIVAITAIVGIIIFQIYSLVRLMKALGYNIVTRIILAIASLLSCLGLIILLVVNQRATTRLQQAGFKVGLMGAKIPNTL